MSQINTSQTIFLNTTLSGGVQPYDPCATWTGNYIAGNGTTGMLPINGNPYLSGVAYIETSGPCVSQGPARGSLTGRFYPNGFTGTVNFWTTAKDASGLSDESNQLSYTVVAISALTVNAGPDQFVNGNPPNILLNGANVSGGGGSYTYAWSAPLTNPYIYTPFSPSTLVLNPGVGNLAANGAYTFTLTATDTVTGLTGSDSVVINVSGNAPPPPPPNILSFSQFGPTTGNNSIGNTLVWAIAGAPITFKTISFFMYGKNQTYNTTSLDINDIGIGFVNFINTRTVSNWISGTAYTYTQGNPVGFKPTATWDAINKRVTYKCNWLNTPTTPTTTTI